MLSIRGIYNGKEIRPLEKINVHPNVQVIITFLENKFHKKSNKIKDLLSLSGTWEDERTSEEIIKDIYGARTVNMANVKI
ncbi:MAG: hypothetical protein H8D22_11530 [Candidatus Cloacimonetes bacterium]|nr:hypothetical protein [Candidatus Cloacimonadota bacterium]